MCRPARGISGISEKSITSHGKKPKVHGDVGQTNIGSPLSMDQHNPEKVGEQNTCAAHIAERLGKLEQLFEKFVCRKNSTSGASFAAPQTPPPTASTSSENTSKPHRPETPGDAHSTYSLGSGILGAQTWTSAPSIRTLVDKQDSRGQYNGCEYSHRTLTALLPSQHDADIIFESSNGWMILDGVYRASAEIYVNKDKQSYALDMRAVAKERPVIVARTLVHLAICLNSLPPEFDCSRLSSIWNLDSTMQNYVATVTSIVACSDEQTMTLHGLEVLLLLALYHLNNASLRQSWLTIRRGLNLAHLMGFQRIITQEDHNPPVPAVSNAKQIWRSFVDLDRYLSLHLRLPFGAEDYPMTGDSDCHLVHRAKINAIIRSVAELDREVSPQGYSSALAVDELLESSVREMPKEFWEVPNIPSTARSPESSAALERLMVQMWHFEIKIFIHLPYLLRAHHDDRYDYSKVTALQASRNVLMRWFALRNSNITQAFCRMAEIGVFIAAVTLTLDIVIELGTKDKIEVQKTKGTDFAMICRLIGEMEKLAKASPREKTAARSAIVLKKILSSLDPNKQPLGKSQHIIPFFGTVELEFKKLPKRTGLNLDSDAGKMMNVTATGHHLPVFSFTNNSLWPKPEPSSENEFDWNMASLWACDARHGTTPATTTTLTETMTTAPAGIQRPSLSLFECIVTSYPPILESLLAQISTATLLELYHTSPHLRDFLRRYPLAWKTLSFRLPQPAAAVGSPGNETPENRERQSKAYSFDALLKQIISPNGTRLTNLDLCNTAVTGIALVGSVLGPRIDTLQHLSVRGCKNVSIKYHIVPFLEPYTLKDAPWIQKDLALKSLYTYRCRHHRRRPYLPSSLIRRDSDSDPTHQLIEICHQLGIWTDTAWCPSPGGRCFRRKDYHAGRAGPLNMEVWVPFDRLWRSSNRIGPVDGTKKLGEHDGRLWEIAETGQDGEPLGPENGNSAGEGKHVPVHERKSHTSFVQDVKCSQCDDVILERCESCSVRMHCMGCRKTLCASCAFNRPIPRKRVKTRHFANLAFGNTGTLGSALGQASGSMAPIEDRNQEEKVDRNRFWWAPGATRSPNLMNESAHDDDSSDSEDGGMNNGMLVPPANREPPKLNMHWCCLEPIFSGGGGIAVLGNGLGGRGADKIRAAPLPRKKEYEDPDFSNTLRPVDYIREMKNNGLYEYVLGEDVDVLSYLKQESLDLQQQTCPRGLCNDCYRSFRWKVSCRACKSPICKEHDFRALKVRKCGYRDLHTEREHVRAHNEPPQRLVIPEFNPNRTSMPDPERTPTASSSSHIDFYSAGDNESESSETPMSQSQILVAPPQHSSIDMSTTTSFNSMSNPDPFPLATSLSFIPVSSARPRSLSVSGVRGRPTSAWSQSSPRAPVNHPVTNPLPLPCNPRHPVQWEGCGAYFCQYPRPVGDSRPQCPAMLKECSECAVLVCEPCSSSSPSCTCTFCTVNYHCPTCTRKANVRAKCRLDAEIKAKQEAELRAMAKQKKDEEERGQADELAGAMYEFFTGVYHDDPIADDEVNVDGSAFLMGDLPIPSPDSITVTTEFGVVEEPANFTTISASGPSPFHTAYDHSDDEENNVEMTEHLHEEDGTLQQGLAQMHLSQNTHADGMSAHITYLPVEVEPEHVHDDEEEEEEDVNDTGEEADIDTDDFDAGAESTFVDEFGDETIGGGGGGVLTPTTTITA
ncbi:diphthamide biosynthesis protein [Stemphylium lycopersici]|nr:diphthamide biosynthesis protein [Stemphylium lycopersici]